VPLVALGLALASAVIHAGWNTMLARAQDTEAATAIMLPVAVIIYAPVAAARWRVAPEAWSYIVASAACELVYFALLGAAYRRYELGVVYPLARGLSPVLLLGVTLAGAGALLSLAQSIAVLLIAAGIVLVWGFKRSGHLRDVGLAVAIAACIAVYTLIDRVGARYADPVVYALLVLVLPAVAYPAAMLKIKGVRVLRAHATWHTMVAAVAMLGAYTLVLRALLLAPAAPVAAVRETSVVFATLGAALVLRERVGMPQFVGTALVTVGIILLA
jgi:drug/metabolite transporter (DMT)-like permease